jgi:DNA adenine methylase
MHTNSRLEYKLDVGIVDSTPETRPFLKWAGGKARLVSDIKRLMPKKYKKFIEPFLGGGALFFSVCPQMAVLADSNSELMNCYEVVKLNAGELLEQLQKFTKLSYNSTTYYGIRKMRIQEDQKVRRAARLVYLNRTAYNGLFRVNRSGQFNVPFGGYKVLSLPGKEVIECASAALKNAELLTADFQETLESYASVGDFVYLDPPYPAVSRYSDFNRYTKDFFSERDHVRLSEQINELDEMGCKFVLSNAEHPLIRELYSNRKFKIVKVSAPRYINCKGDKRGDVAELLITNNFV